MVPTKKAASSKAASSKATSSKAASSAVSAVKREKKIHKILIVDDHSVVCAGLTLLINKQAHLCVCGEARDAHEALALLEKEKPDMALVDISLKGISGLELTADIRERYPDTRVLILSMHDEFLYAERALQAGAAGYVMKKEASETLITAIEKVLSGSIYVSEVINEQLLKNLVYGRKRKRGGSVRDLSNREFEVFQLVGQGFSTGEIADKLSLSKKTIETYRMQIKNKLNLNSTRELNRYAITWMKSER